MGNGSTLMSYGVSRSLLKMRQKSAGTLLRRSPAAGSACRKSRIELEQDALTMER